MKYSSFYNGTFDLSIEEIHEKLRMRNRDLESYPSGAIIEILSKLGKKIIKDKSALAKEGTYYLATWLSKKNLLKYYNDNFKATVQESINHSNDSILFVRPRGIVVHWVAGNVPTLSFFSLFQSLICRNSNIMKISSGASEFFKDILQKLREIKVSYKNKVFDGEILYSNTAFVNFSHSEGNLSTQLSMIADFRIIWGGGRCS